MKYIDLKKFALHSQKIPRNFLANPTSAQNPSSWKLLTAHAYDFFLCLTLTNFLGAFYITTFRSFMTRNLQTVYSDAAALQFFMVFFPLTVASYFFSCYFLNDGQTWGMHLTKTRIKMKSKDFRESLRWVFHSFVLCLSGGTYMIPANEKWKNFSSHDYLYNELLLHKDIQAINLLDLTTQEIIEEHYEETLEAA